jgi:hypothetical protein
VQVQWLYKAQDLPEFMKNRNLIRHNELLMTWEMSQRDWISREAVGQVVNVAAAYEEESAGFWCSRFYDARRKQISCTRRFKASGRIQKHSKCTEKRSVNDRRAVRRSI